jgi:hypothetical protein
MSTGFVGFFTFVLFLVVLFLGFVFEWQKGALDWTSYFYLFFFKKFIQSFLSRSFLKTEKKK